MGKKVELLDIFPIYGYERNSLISKEKGCITVPLELELPEVFTLDESDYIAINELFSNVINVLGSDIVIHKQDYFFKECYKPLAKRLEGDFMERGNEMHFTDRPYLRTRHFLFISKVPSNYIHYDPRRVNSFLNKNRAHFLEKTIPEEFTNSEVIYDFENSVESVCDLINSSTLVKCKVLSYDALFDDNGLYSRYFSLSNDNKELPDIDFSGNEISISNKKAQFFTLENLDQFTKNHVGQNEYYGKFTTRNNLFPIGNLFSIGFKIPYEHVINQYIYIPNQEKVLSQLRKKAKRFNQFANGKKDDGNSIYANQIYEFNKDILENHKQIVYYHLNVLGLSENSMGKRKMCNNISGAFKKLKINIKENSLDRKNLFFAGVPGNSVGLSTDMYLPMSSDMASSMLYYEGEYRDSSYSVNGIRLVDRTSGRPLTVSVYEEPEKNDWIFNRGTLIASGSGGGKSFVANHYMASELRRGAEAVIMEDGNSYDKITQVFDGVIIEHNDDKPFTYNPFKLDDYDVVYRKINGKDTASLSEDKIVFLVTVLKLITGGTSKEGPSIPLEVRNTVLENLIVGYYNEMWSSKRTDFKFDSFFEYSKKSIASLIHAKGISRTIFDADIFLFLLEKYYKDGPRGKLLNHEDERISQLSKEKVVYFKLGKLLDNELLFPITALMIMEIFTKKLNDKSKLSINKMMVVDEAWKALVRPELEAYFNGQSRMARKYGGQPIFISQKVDDFISSEVIKTAIVVNSHIKIFLDMRDLENSFEKVQSTMGLGEKQKQLILSINKDLPEKRKLREVAFCWMDRVKVYGVETSLIEKCIYETNATECDKINTIYKNNNNNWELTAKSYAYSSSI